MNKLKKINIFIAPVFTGQIKYFIFWFILFFSLLINSDIIYSQEIKTNPERNYTFKNINDSLLIWPETIIPGTISWEKNQIPMEVKYALIENKIIPDWERSNLNGDSVTVRFKVLPFPFHDRITLYDSSQIRIVEGDIFYNPVQPKTTTDLIESSGLAYDGALTRGFSMGNNQSLVFDSELNLQLGGNIGDGYEIKAAITDNNLPIQPDGTTRQIQEFDKVYIEIKKDQHSILAGDFDAINPAGYFMRYNRKLKGAQYSFSGNNKTPWDIKGSAAVSRGKFTRQSIIPSEGNQGPYPLRGENGELFIIVLAGSERVYIDGQLLVRGEDADYIMDYNKSEITFTRNILINIRHRITVEFEYAQFNFQKSHNTFEARYQEGKISSYLNFFQENDSKSVTGDLELTAEDLALLNMAGDAGDQFYKSGIKESPEGFNSNLILYVFTDTIVSGILYTDIIKWSTDPEKANLLATFSEVGNGNGDYIISQNPSPNGRVYEWIAPDPGTGISRGNFEPIIPLQAPQQKQMLTVGGELPISKSGKISAEFGYSRQDLNRYSSLNDNDNGGTALKLNIINAFDVGKSWKLTPFASYEGSGNHFRSLDPYRNPEFSRDWNLLQVNSPSQEHLPSVGLRFGRSSKVFSQYRYDGLFRGNSYNGNRHTGQILYDTAGWKIDAVLGVLDSRDVINTTHFFRSNINLERVVVKEGDWRLGLLYFEDKNEVKDGINDTLRFTSFIQNKESVYFKNNPEANSHFYAAYHRERPKLAIGNEFRVSEKVIEWNLGGHFHQWEDFKIEYTIKHRDVEPLISQSNQQNRNLLGRLDLRSELIKKAIRWSLGYEIGNGQEPKVEYKYIKVQKGEGVYIWVDDGNGIEELNEFEEAPFADQGEYIKLSVFNNDFIRTRALGLQQTVNIELKNVVAKGAISKMAALSTYQLTRKIREENDSPYWNPFYQQYADTSILGSSSTMRNILYWNRSSTLYDIQLGQVRQKSQVLQTSGFDVRQADDLTLRCRISMRKKMDVVLNVREGKRENRSQFFDTRNYTIDQFEAGPELNVILKDKFRLTGSYQYLFQKNRMATEEFDSHKFSFESVWRKSNSIDFRIQISLVNIQYVTAGNMNVDFAILQGLQNGSNVLWNAQFNTRLNQSLILTLQYNGRNTGEVKTIHTGTAQVRASF